MSKSKNLFTPEVFVACKCNPKTKKCPVITIFDDGFVLIEDDFGGRVRMEHEEFKIVMAHFKDQMDA